MGFIDNAVCVRRSISHEAHNWRYEDEPVNDFHRCPGVLIEHVDVYERPTNETR